MGAYYDELENPTLPRYNRVVYGGFAMAVGFFVSIAAAGHRTFGAASQGLILNSFAGADKLANAARALVGVAARARTPCSSRACATATLTSPRSARRTRRSSARQRRSPWWPSLFWRASRSPT